jgi:16S rRNA (cytidine1402-2'-O)-methyltransferase
VLKLLLAELPVKQAARLGADITGTAKNQLYQRALELKDL